MPVQSVGANASYIPTLRESQNLRIEFSRNPNAFPLNKYIKIHVVKKQKGKYLRVDEKNHARLSGQNLDEFIWADTMDRPVLNNNGDQFELDDYVTIRRNFGERLGNLATEQADFDIPGVLRRTLAQKAMTARTLLVHQGLQNNANWPAANIFDVGANPSLGLWVAALSSNPIIKKTLNRAVQRIMLATNSTVRRKDLQLVVGPELALIMSETQEVIDLIKQSPDARNMLTGSVGYNEYLLPDQMYGINLVVEDTVVTTTPRGSANQVQKFIMDYKGAYLMSRPGKLVSPGGGPDYSTVALMVKEDMKIEEFPDARNRRDEMNIVDDVGFASTAPISGVRLDNLY